MSHPLAVIHNPADVILTIRGQRVILDADLAVLYGVPTKALNQAVKRNQERFPEAFAFHLTAKEKQDVVTNCDHLARLKFSHQLPMSFTEHGVLMAANVINSPQAIKMSIAIIQAFIRLRETIAASQVFAKRLAEIERTLTSHDSALRDLYQKIRPLLLPPPDPSPKRRIGFNAT